MEGEKKEGKRERDHISAGESGQIYSREILL